ncbi:MAG: AAA family ATPase [Methylococcales bacterium]|jgi:exodeoxyribonuclease V alpha subunit|nr:AAA family ATPase [Methylococcales bacterium]
MQTIDESLQGIVQRITYHNEDNGWSVLKVQPFDSPSSQETVIVHQTKVFAGATMAFKGAWILHPKFGRQFKATEATEKKPATAAALEKYLGSGLIKGVGPKTAHKIVKYFQKDTLEIFESDIERLVEVPGIASRKLASIELAWTEHKAIRDVMMFLQGHGISTLFAVKIYKEYKDNSIAYVLEDPYRLASDFYGIGFFSADKVALSIGLALDSPQRVTAAIRHVLAGSREHGHCYLTESQIQKGVNQLLEMDFTAVIPDYLQTMEQQYQLKTRLLANTEGIDELCYYSKTLYYDEETVAEKLKGFKGTIDVDHTRVANWVDQYCQVKSIALSDEQSDAVKQIVGRYFSILTGGPGCGKTTTILVFVKLLEAMKKKVLLVAPTGRAAQRMSEVIGNEAKTIHRLLEWKGGTFQKNEEQPLEAEFLIVDEGSMLDISLTASLLKATPKGCQVLFIGDPDQLPSIGAGNVLKDIIHSNEVPIFRLTKVFRQAQASKIIQYAHLINQGKMPEIESPFHKPEVWQDGSDCLFIDSDEMTQEQMRFITRVKHHFEWQAADLETTESPFSFKTKDLISSYYDNEFIIPKKFQHVDLGKINDATSDVEQLKTLLKTVHPWSSLNYGLPATDIMIKLYLDWIPKYYGQDTEIQILSPMTRGSLGTANLNKLIQQSANPPAIGKHQIKIGERVFREGDRVIHRRNNYDLKVFNGDIGQILSINNEDITCVVSFYPDNREVEYKKENIMELDLAYAITIHKSQGSEFKAVIIPVLTQHFKMLYRNLIYTGLTRAKTLAVFVGTRQALSMAIRQQDTSLRQTALQLLLK